jgi:hypothetical protein|tara:strand:+ start:180 stop:443 length:264 start_codon:yes stop_codon:yes gene_type:complete
MTKLSIGDKEYDSADFTEEQTNLFSILNLGQNSVSLLNHMLQCTQAIQQMKTQELKTSLEGPQTIGDVLDKKAKKLKKSVKVDADGE